MRELTLANLIIKHCIEKNNPISNLQLQKILYFVQLKSINLFTYKHRILENAVFEAWRFGPVIRIVYEEYCNNAGLKITQISEFLKTSQTTPPDFLYPFIDKSLSIKPFTLVALSHNEGGAWDKVYQEGKKNIIPDDLLIEEAKNIVKVDRDLGCNLF